MQDRMLQEAGAKPKGRPGAKPKARPVQAAAAKPKPKARPVQAAAKAGANAEEGDEDYDVVPPVAPVAPPGTAHRCDDDEDDDDDDHGGAEEITTDEANVCLCYFY